MPSSEPSLLNQLQLYRPPCSRCGAPTLLARIEPAAGEHYDLRTFECASCAHSEVVKVKYR